MVYQFSANWADEVAAISTLPEFQNITVTLIDPDAVVGLGYDIETGNITYTSDGSFWTGQARLIGRRWGVNRENSETGNGNTESSVLVQFPQNQNFGTEESPIYRIRRGIKLRVDTAAMNPALETMVFTATSDLQGGSAAARTVQFALDGDALVSSVTPTPEPEEPEEP